MKLLTKLAFVTAMAFSASSAVLAQEAQATSDEHSSHHTQADAQDTAGASQNEGGVAGGQMVDGVVRKVDKDAGKITIRHEELKDLGMPAMTMVFRAKDPAMLDQVKAGDKVQFQAEKSGGKITLTKLSVTQ